MNITPMTSLLGKLVVCAFMLNGIIIRTP